MKISIITLHRFDNVGSCLQACALSQYLQSKNNEVVLLDYTPFYKEYYEPIKIAAKVLNRRNISARMDKIGEVLNEYSNLSKRFYNNKRIGKLVEGCDLLVSGGDQIWNPMYPNYRDDAYYYYGINNIRKIAYGSSVSVNELSGEQISYLKERITLYDSVNVREKRTAELFIENNINKNTNYIMDPVFLPDKELYCQMAEKSSYKENGEYILLYHMDEGKELDMMIDKIREITGYKIISLIGNRKYWYSDLYIKDYGPYDFLNLIKNAKMVFTGSFHALCFSLIFKTPFIIQLPEKSPNRIVNILNEIGLSDRIISEKNSIDAILKRRIGNDPYDSLEKIISISRNILDKAVLGYKE